jgi:hypothetical protein
MTNSIQYQNQLAHDRFGLQIAARLSDASDNLSHDISERLRAARVQALDKRQLAMTRTVNSMTALGGAATLSFGNGNSGWLDRFAGAIPLLVLVLGLIAISTVQNDNRAAEIAEIDAAILTDDLPPAAYMDPGFTQFLKTISVKNQ